MSEDSVQVSAAPFAPLNKPVVRTVDIDQPPKDYHTAELLPLPSKEVLKKSVEPQFVLGNWNIF